MKDPGWRRAFLAAVMPSLVLRRLRRSPSDGLTLLRVTFLAFCIAIALIG
ncbi:MAG TPA: hypothetical protein VK988_11385 [Acidimicrobiales bacterium]|nr:hypothetical protein [Acidimicrobiales bacterium]